MANPFEVKALCLQLLAQHELFEYDFLFNKRKRHTGICRFATSTQRGRIELSIYYVQLNSIEDVKDTICHEVAHALAWRRYRHTGHGEPWKQLCKEIGARPERCCKALMPVGQFVARCGGCGREFRRHRRPAKRIWCRACGPELGLLTYVRDIA